MTTFDIITATPQQIVDRVTARLRDGNRRCADGGEEHFACVCRANSLTYPEKKEKANAGVRS